MRGAVTALARRLWGLEKRREEDDLRHALDAVAPPALTPGRIKFITERNKARETAETQQAPDPETGDLVEIDRMFPPPWKGFRREALARLSDDPAAELAALGLDAYADDPPDARPIIVSRMPIRKATGAIHAETIRSVREDNGKRVGVVRKRLTDLKAADLERLYAPETNQKLYEAIGQRMAERNGDAAKAFAEPLYKPTNSGASRGRRRAASSSARASRRGSRFGGGVADNESMVRADVFRKNGKRYLAPVYVSHVMAGGASESRDSGAQAGG